MATPPPPPLTPLPPSHITLNLLPPKPPKEEPIHIPLSSPSPTPLQSLPPNTQNLSEEALFAEYFRLASQYLSSSSPSSSQALIPLPQTPNPNSLPLTSQPPSPNSLPLTSQPPLKKRKPRSHNMVRVSSLTLDDLIYFRNLIRRARITFESIRLQITHNQQKAESLGLTDFVKTPRPDMKAAALMADRELWLNRDKRIIGSIPGISVGDCFFFRMELCVLGLHGQVQAGIDYVPIHQSASREPIATSVIVSGGYEDDDDKGEVIIYTGHGGRDNLGKQCADQKLESGNLALERSMTYCIEIRVIRGIRAKNSHGKIYIYDGLYKVVDCWFERGKSGFGVFKYKMLRLANQEQMGTVNFKMAEGLRFDPLMARPVGYFEKDLSMGRENLPVCLFNDIDGDKEPVLFEYLARPIFPVSAVSNKLAIAGGGCGCQSECKIGCYCMEKNCGEFAYDNNGILLRGKPLVYECGPFCNCAASCPNRVSQKGIRTRLEVFRSRETGWGVRSLDLIKAGSFICEFSGIILTKQQLDVMRSNNIEQCVVYPNEFPNRWKDWGDIQDVIPDFTTAEFPKRGEVEFGIDVSKARNVACYLSHSCSPNVFVQYVLFDHYNVNYPHVMVFAMENIPPMRELSVDYGVVEEEFVGKLTNGES